MNNQIESEITKICVRLAGSYANGMPEYKVTDAVNAIVTLTKAVASKNFELRTRVAELEENKKDWENWASMTGKEFKNYNDLRKENKELQNRLSTLNAEIEGNGGYKDMLKGFQFKIESLESKLSTFLKASEGMEKALKDAISMWRSSHDYLCAYDVEEKCKVALADFRAVKDGK